VWLSGLALLVAQSALAELRIVQLKHRSAEELAPVIRPLLAPDEVLQATDYRLIIRASAQTLGDIERLVAKLDVAPRNLTITVRQEVLEVDTRERQKVDGTKPIGRHTRIVLPREPASSGDGLTITGSRPDSLSYRARAEHTSERAAHNQVVRVLEGQRAHIHVGQSVPHVEQILTLSGHGALLTQGVVMQNITTGFEVLPRLRGERVLLEITPRLLSLEQPAIGLVSFQNLTTKVSVKRGEWFDLGQIAGTRHEVHRAILDSASAQSSTRRTILVKID